MMFSPADDSLNSGRKEEGGEEGTMHSEGNLQVKTEGRMTMSRPGSWEWGLEPSVAHRSLRWKRPQERFHADTSHAQRD